MTTRQCDGCQDKFIAEGLEWICPTCEFNGYFRRHCSECGTPFDTRDLGLWKCCFCNAEDAPAPYDQFKYVFDSSTDT